MEVEAALDCQRKWLLAVAKHHNCLHVAPEGRSSEVQGGHFRKQLQDTEECVVMLQSTYLRPVSKPGSVDRFVHRPLRHVELNQ